MAALGSVEPANHPRSRLSIEVLKFRRLPYKEKCILIFFYVTEDTIQKNFCSKIVLNWFFTGLIFKYYMLYKKR